MKTDKLLHVLCGYIIALTVGIWLPWLGALVGVAAAFGKEFLWDRLLKRGTFEWADINATLVGVLTGFSIAFLRASIAQITHLPHEGYGKANNTPIYHK